MQAETRSRFFGWWAFLIIVAGLGLRIGWLGAASLWYDEILTDYRVQGSLGDCWRLLLEIGNQTPLYFTIVYFFPHHNEFWLRLPSVLIGTASIPLLMFVVVRLYRRYDWALAAGALLAFNPYHVWLSRTARPYPLVFLLSLLASYFFLRLLSGQRTRTLWAGFIVSSMAAYLTHYFTIGLPLAQYVLFAFILKRNRVFFRQWLLAQAVAGIPTLIWVYALTQQETVAFGIGWIPRPGLQDLPLTLWNMTIGYNGGLVWYELLGLAAAAAGLGVGLVRAARNRRQDPVSFYWFWLLIAPLALALVVSRFRPLYVDRYFMVFLPAILLLMVQGWDHLPQRRQRLGLAGVFFAVCLAQIGTTLESGDDEKEDWRGAARYIEREIQADDGLLTGSPIELLALKHYTPYQGERAWLLDAPPVHEQYTRPVKRVWAVYRNPREDGHIQGVLPDFDPFEPDDAPMSGWLQTRQNHVLTQREFNGVTVLLVDVSDERP